MIVSLTGKADHFELFFTRQQGNTWAAEVPPNLETGRYIVELCAVDGAGNVGYWRGVLYMSENVRVSIDIFYDEYQTWVINDVKVEAKDRYSYDTCLMEELEHEVSGRFSFCLMDDLEAVESERYASEKLAGIADHVVSEHDTTIIKDGLGHEVKESFTVIVS